MAEGIARREFQRLGLDWTVASAGTGDWHIGHCADTRAIRCAGAAGYPLAEHRGRQVCADDFQRHDWLLAMDRANLAALRAMAPPAARARCALLLEAAGTAPPAEVPDPWFGDEPGFDEVLALLRPAILALPQRLAGRGG